MYFITCFERYGKTKLGWPDILDITRHEKCKQLQKSIDNLKDMRIIITEQND